MQEERKGYVRPVTAETAMHQFGPLRQAACLDHPLARLPRVDRHASGTKRSDLREMQEPYRKIEASGESYEQALQGDAGREILEIAARHGMRALSPEEIRQQMPGFPVDRP